MASTAVHAVSPIESGAKRHAETPLRSEEKSRGSYRFKNKRMKNGHGSTSTILKTNGSNEEILLEDVKSLLSRLNLTSQKDSSLPELRSEVQVKIEEISSTGDGLGLQEGTDSSQVYVVPFTAPGDTVTAKIFKHDAKSQYSLADFVRVTSPSPHRDDSLVKCPYFSTCSGCQFQMLPYSYQLAHKKSIVEKAYKNFSNLPPHLIPQVGDTIGSPLQYGYRTKLTPHFDGPPDARRSDGRNGIRREFTQMPHIGFMKKGTRIVIDIEDCPIGTDALRKGNTRERARVKAELHKYHKGATLLLRESTQRVTKAEFDAFPSSLRQDGPDAVVEDRGEHYHIKTCVTDPNAKTTEYVVDHVFVNPAGSFFQNNNSILPVFTRYIRENILSASSSGITAQTVEQPHASSSQESTSQIKHLLDTYSGSGLFTITLSSLFATSLGIDISPASIASATVNASLSHLPPEKARFMAADAAQLFKEVKTDPKETVVVVDPPRKGCDEQFLRQLVRYGPERVVYVSCNVHSQARDVGLLVTGAFAEHETSEGVTAGTASDQGLRPGKHVLYDIESLRGFDFFPQTGHVESVAVLRRRREDSIQ